MVFIHLISIDSDIIRKTANLGYLGLLPTHPDLQWVCQLAQNYAVCKLHGKDNQLHIKHRSSVFDQKHHKEDDHKWERRRRKMHLLCIFNQQDLDRRRCTSLPRRPSVSVCLFLPWALEKINPLGLAWLSPHSHRGSGRTRRASNLITKNRLLHWKLLTSRSDLQPDIRSLSHC